MLLLLVKVEEEGVALPLVVTGNDHIGERIKEDGGLVDGQGYILDRLSFLFI